jgi:hypothetical protein
LLIERQSLLVLTDSGVIEVTTWPGYFSEYMVGWTGWHNASEAYRNGRHKKKLQPGEGLQPSL